jgi:hypothetical protein
MAAKTKRELIMNRWGVLKNERSSWFAHWNEITNYLLPRNGRYFVTDRDRGQRRHNAIYDDTGTMALNTLAAGMMSGMTSPARPWLAFGVENKQLMDSPTVKAWLQQVTDIVLGIFRKGNVYNVLHQLYTELGAFGTCAAIVLDDFQDVMRLYPLTAGEYCIATNWRGEVVTLYREFQKTVGEVVKEFGRENCSPGLLQQFDRGDLDTWVTILQAIEPREDRDPSKLDALNMPWKSVYWEIGGQPDVPLRESGYERFPALVARWNLAGGDIYGNSPGMMVLGDVKQLQQEQLRKSQAIDYMTKPPLGMPTAMKNREVDGMPGGITFFDQPGATGTRNLFQVQLNLDHLLADIQQVQGRINQGMFADLFLMVSGSTNPNMTATEVAARQEEKMLMLGPVLERMDNELLNPLVSSTYNRALKAGLLPPAPPELHGHPLQVEYISVLAQAQRAIGTNSVDRFVAQMVQMIAPVKPEVLDNFNVDEWTSSYSAMLNVDPSLINDPQMVALVRKQRADAQAAAQKAQMGNLQADSAQKLANAPTQGGGSNALQDLLNQFSGYGSPSPSQV